LLWTHTKAAKLITKINTFNATVDKQNAKQRLKVDKTSAAPTPINLKRAHSGNSIDENADRRKSASHGKPAGAEPHKWSPSKRTETSRSTPVFDSAEPITLRYS
jgi:hypothetical protein